MSRRDGARACAGSLASGRVAPHSGEARGSGFRDRWRQPRFKIRSNSCCESPVTSSSSAWSTPASIASRSRRRIPLLVPSNAACRFPAARTAHHRGFPLSQRSFQVLRHVPSKTPLPREEHLISLLYLHRSRKSRSTNRSLTCWPLQRLRSASVVTSQAIRT
jgi:hypothetical protein